MRTAVINELKTITEFGNRVKEAFTAVAGYSTPYATVKMLEDPPDSRNKYGSFKGFQVFIYNSPDSFTTLDDLAKKVRAALHNETLMTDDSPARFFTSNYVMTQGDFFDDKKNLFMKRVDFDFAIGRN